MKRKTLIVALAFAATATYAQELSSGIDKANLNTSVKPGNDFYEYAAGGCMKTHPLDAEHPMNGAFVDLQESVQKQIRSLIEEYAGKPQQKGSLGQKIGSLYKMMMDSVRLNKDGYAPLKPVLARINAVKNRKEYQLVAADIDRQGGNTLMFGIGVGADQRNAAISISTTTNKLKTCVKLTRFI